MTQNQKNVKPEPSRNSSDIVKSTSSPELLCKKSGDDASRQVFPLCSFLCRHIVIVIVGVIVIVIVIVVNPPDVILSAGNGQNVVLKRSVVIATIVVVGA